VFGLPGFQRGLLRELDGLDRPGWAAVPGLELPGELTAPDVDHQPPGGPGLEQPLVDPDDLPHRSLARLARPLGELHTEPVAQQSLQPGVVPLGRRDGEFVQRPTVQGQPAPGRLPPDGLDLVADRDVRVQVGVTGAAVAVRERRRDQAPDVDLPGAAAAQAGVGGVVLQPAQALLHSHLVGALDDLGDVVRRNRPQGADALHGSEGQVVAGDGGRLLAHRAGQEPRQFAAVARRPTVLAGEHLPPQSGADRGPFGLRDRPVPRQTSTRVSVLEPPDELDAERRRALDELVGRAEPGRGQHGPHPLPAGDHRLLDGLGVGVPALPEQRQHLRLADLGAAEQGPGGAGGLRQPRSGGPVPGCHSGGLGRREKLCQAACPVSHPQARALTTLRVVLPQAVPAAVRGVRSRHLPGQVGVAVPRGELVQRHHPLTVPRTSDLSRAQDRAS